MPAWSQDSPRVSILIASHNRLELLKDAISSALAQDYPNVEVVIVDDGSADATRSWLQSISTYNERLMVQYQENNGPGSARAKGVKICSGEIICILDSDDRLLPNAVSTIVRHFQREPDLELVYVNILKRIENRTVRSSRYPRFVNNRQMIKWIMLRPLVPFKHSGTAFRRATAIQLGNYDPHLPRKIDIDLFLRFLTAGKKIKLIEDPPLVIFRMHKDSISRNRYLGIKCWLKLIRKYGTGLCIPVLFLAILRIVLEMAKGLVESVRYLR